MQAWGQKQISAGALQSDLPFGKPWELINDGDLWKVAWVMLKQRGMGTVRVTKVKGHATEEHVQQGLVQEMHKQGNDQADSAATCGVQATGHGKIQYMIWVKKRHRAYMDFVAKIQKLTAAVLKLDKEHRL